MNNWVLAFSFGFILLFFSSCRKIAEPIRSKIAKVRREASGVSIANGRLYFPDMETFQSYFEQWNASEKSTVLDEQQALGFTSFERLWEEKLTAYEELGSHEASLDEVMAFANENASIMTITTEDFESTVPNAFRLVCNKNGEFQINEYVYFIDNSRCITIALKNYDQLQVAKQSNVDAAHYVNFNTTAKYASGNDLIIWSPDWLGFENKAIRSNYRATVKIYANWFGMWNPYSNVTFEYRYFDVSMKAQKKGWTGIWYANAQTFNFTYIWYLTNWGYNDLITKNNIYTSNSNFILCAYSGILPGDKRLIKDYYHDLCSRGLNCPQGELIISGNVENSIFF